MSVVLFAACALIGYSLGSIPTSYLIVKHLSKLDLLEQGSSHVSATAVYRELGWKPFFLVFAVDILKGILAIFIAHLLTGSVWAVALAAVAAAVGHCWSVFIRFRGGLGALIMIGMLFYTDVAFTRTHMPWEFMIGGGVALVVMLTAKRSTLATVLWFVAISIALLFQMLAFGSGTLAMAVLPLVLLGVQFAKRWLSSNQGDVYKNELSSDFKRVKAPEGGKD